MANNRNNRAKDKVINVIESVRLYIDKIASDGLATGMKALLLDDYTKQVVGMVYSKTAILDKGVYLMEKLPIAHDDMKHLKAVVFMRPTPENADKIAEELSNPHFMDYHIFFSNSASGEIIDRIAAADVHDLVAQVHEYYADYMPVNEELFSFNAANGIALSVHAKNRLPISKFEESVQQHASGLCSVLLSLKAKPVQIRCTSSSEPAKRIAAIVAERAASSDMFQYRPHTEPVLIVLDRRDDPITPLLTQWTYQSMIHELIGMNNNRVILKAKIAEDMNEVVLSSSQDDFFAAYRYANFGDLDLGIKTLLSSLQQESKSSESLGVNSSIEDMRRFIDQFPQQRALNLKVAKHVYVSGEISREVRANNLLPMSELEQDIVCSTQLLDSANHFARTMEILNNESVSMKHKLRLATIYSLRYEKRRADLEQIKNALNSFDRLPSNQPSIHALSTLDAVLAYSGEALRSPGLFGSVSQSIAGTIRAFGNNNNDGDGENAYTRHVPLSFDLVDQLMKDRLRDRDIMLPAVVMNPGGGCSFIPMPIPVPPSSSPRLVIVFIVGGVTFEEAARSVVLNASQSLYQLLVGGSNVLNSSMFLQEVKESFAVANDDESKMA